MGHIFGDLWQLFYFRDPDGESGNSPQIAKVEKQNKTHFKAPTTLQNVAVGIVWIQFKRNVDVFLKQINGQQHFSFELKQSEVWLGKIIAY